MVDRVWISRPHLLEFLEPRSRIVDEVPKVEVEDSIFVRVEPGEFDPPVLSPLERKRVRKISVFVSKWSWEESFPRNFGIPETKFDEILSERRDYVDWMIDSLDLSDYKYLSNVEDLDDEDFDKFVKKTFILGRWYKDAWKSEDSVKAYDLLKSFSEGRDEFSEACLEAFDDNNSGVCFSAFLTFLRKAMEFDPKEFDGNRFYGRQLRSAKEQISGLDEKLKDLCRSPSDLRTATRVLSTFV